MKKTIRIMLGLVACTCLLFLTGDSADAISMSSITNDTIKQKEGQIGAAEQEKKQLQGSLSNVKKLKQQLENQKNDLRSYVTLLDSQLEEIEENILTLKIKIAEKEGEIDEATLELNNALAIEEQQKTYLVSYIRKMYEKKATYVTDLISQSSGLGDMLNKADFMESIVGYSRVRWEEFQANRQLVELCKEELELQKEILDTAKAGVEEEQRAMEELIAQKEADITAYETDIGNQEKAIREYEQDIAQQEEEIKLLELAIAEEKKRIVAANGIVLSYDGGKFKLPIASYTRISDPYGMRFHPTLKVNQMHNGIDYAAPKGTAIYAAYDGVVVAASYSSSMGNYVMIDHGTGLYTIYMHASALYVKKDDIVARGDTIAAVGTTGRSTGNHLHFGVRYDGEYVNPSDYL